MKEWIVVNHTAQGQTSVRVTLQEGNTTVRWAVKSAVGHLGQGKRDARLYAEKALEQLGEVT